MTEFKNYPVRVFWSEDDSGYIAEAFDLPGCSAFGETQAAALAELPDAIDAWSKAALAAGNPIPKPSQLSEPEEFSGRIGLRLPKSLHGKLSKIAAIEGQSLNSQIVNALTEFQAKWQPLRSAIFTVPEKHSAGCLILNTAHHAGWWDAGSTFAPKDVVASASLMSLPLNRKIAFFDMKETEKELVAVSSHG